MTRNGRWQLRDLGQAEARREAILAVLGTGPSATRMLANATEIPMGCLLHHLGVLAKRGLVRHERAQQFVYYARTDKAWSIPMARAEHDPGIMEVVRLVGDRRMHQRAIVDALPWPRATSQHRIKRAVAHGLLKPMHSGRYILYTRTVTT